MATYSDETVMRYVDGELDNVASAEIEAAMVVDAALADQVALFAETRLSARNTMRPMLDEPVPPQLLRAVEAMAAKATSKQSASFGTGPSRRTLVPANDWLRIAAAACIAAVVGGAGGYFLRGGAAPAHLSIAEVDRDEAFAALGSVPTGAERTFAAGARFRAIASFAGQDDVLCREFELDLPDSSGVTSVACHEADGWRVRFAVRGANDAGYAPASPVEALEAYLTAVGAGQPMTADEEARALQNLPRARE